MSNPRPLSEEERDELVAFLDGELTGSAARAVESRLSLDPRLRAEADTLKRTWEMLDYLPRPEPSQSFTERTLSRLEPTERPFAARRWVPAAIARWPWPHIAVGVGWAAAVLVAGWIGYSTYGWLSPREPGEPELVRDLRLIENKRFYDLVEDVRFLERLDHPDLFGEDTGS